MENYISTKNDYARSKEFFDTAISINKSSGHKEELFNNYNNLAAIYFQQKNFDKALEYALLALGQIDPEKDTYPLSFLYMNIGGLYAELKNYPIAASYLNTAKNLEIRYNFSESLVLTYVKLASVYQDFNMQDSGRYYIKKAIALAQSTDNPTILADVWKEVYQYYGQAGDYKAAYQYFTEFSRIDDPLQVINDQQKFEQLRAVYDVERKERENQLLQQRLAFQELIVNRQRIIIGGILFIVVLLGLSLVLIIKSRQKKRLASLVIARQQEELFNQDKALMLQKERELTLELDYKNRQLTSYTLQLIRNNEFVSKVIRELHQLVLEMNPRETEKRERISRKLFLISGSLLQVATGKNFAFTLRKCINPSMKIYQKNIRS
ncbi:MAG: tetratricopeptide repeat protein [Bacteroidetes bacterium]|nr:tetratricopeptide repeat protein [Bacteroidota bacterium]